MHVSVFVSKRKTWGERTSPSRPDTHPQAPERRAREALTHTWAAYTRGDAEYSGKLHHDTTFPIAPSTLVVSLCLPAQVYRGWPAAAVARPFRMRSPASLDASVAPTAGPAWRCPAPPRSAHRLGLRARALCALVAPSPDSRISFWASIMQVALKRRSHGRRKS